MSSNDFHYWDAANYFGGLVASPLVLSHCHLRHYYYHRDQKWHIIINGDHHHCHPDQHNHQQVALVASSLVARQGDVSRSE